MLQRIASVTAPFLFGLKDMLPSVEHMFAERSMAGFGIASEP
jgi:hypothetical protein